MKKRFFTLTFLILTAFALNTSAQTEATSPRYSFHIAKEVKPPLWEIVQEPEFVDADGNQAIDANENCKIVMKVKNIGTGEGTGLTAKISVSGSSNGISVFDRRIPDIPVGGTATVEFPVTANMNTVDGKATFTVFINEPMGFTTDKFPIVVTTQAFQAPMIEVKDCEATSKDGGKLVKMDPFQVTILIQNTQYGLGEDVTVTLKYPENVVNLEGRDLVDIFPKMSAGETRELKYKFLINNIYDKSTLPLQVFIREKYGKYAKDTTIVFELNQTLGKGPIEVAAKISAPTTIEDAQLRSDVDRNIPISNSQNPYRYAIIIGNQDYHSFQKDLNSEQDVPFAAEDANIFKQYCVKTLGVEERNVVALNNATGAKMNQEIDYITRLAARDPEAEIIFYYAGHGFPDENTKEPYLIPVDVNASNLKSAIPLYDLYSKLCSTGAQKVTVFLDACFSGGGREAGLVASRGIKLTPKRDALSGNIVVFSATSADQTALPYTEKNHGMFTYFLLKKLQESKGQCTYSELYNYLNKNVGDHSLRVNRKDQTPEVNMASQVQESWGEWRFN